MKHFRHTSAFTMLELVFVIAVIGIIAALALPRFERDNLQEAADQLVSHIRYTQHLAMQDDKFNPNDNQWFKRRWQILFSPTANGTISYSILSDTPSAAGNYQGNPKANATYTKVSVARNPLDTNLYLIGTTYSTFDNSSDERITKDLDIGKKYGIKDIDLSDNCQLNGSTRIAFDYLGRPLRGTFHNYTSPYPSVNSLITNQCVITLTNSAGNSIQIAIEPETGYTHIL